MREVSNFYGGVVKFADLAVTLARAGTQVGASLTLLGGRILIRPLPGIIVTNSNQLRNAHHGRSLPWVFRIGRGVKVEVFLVIAGGDSNL